ncbi:hypothetical protein DFH27DRAFT_73914 [Peziza echinospora]|nr:hypothetical protein DFH27DRAFT_73914 [Peziza echinospora]
MWLTDRFWQTLIEASEEKIKDLSDEEKATTKLINADERRKISEKPIHLAVLKELTDVLEFVTRAEAAEEKRFSNEKAQLAAAHAEQLKEAKEEGRKEAEAQADENLRLLLAFLRTVSVRRVAMSSHPLDPADNQAFEAALIAVYEGSEKGFTACQNLFSGLEEPVKESGSTWARLKELCGDERNKSTQDSQSESAAETTEAPETTAESNESTEINQDTEAPAEAPTQETILENETTEEGYIIVPTTQDTIPAPPAATSIDESAGNAAAEYPTETDADAATTETATTAPIDTPLETPAESVADGTQKGTEDVPKTNGDFRHPDGRGRGGHRGHHRGRSDYRGEGYRGEGYRGRGGFRGEHRGGHRGGEHRGEPREGEPRGERREGEQRGERREVELRGGEYRGEGRYRGDGRGGYGGRGGDRPYRGRGEGYTGGRGDGFRGGYRGRGGFQNKQQQTPPPPPPPVAQPQTQAE